MRGPIREETPAAFLVSEGWAGLHADSEAPARRRTSECGMGAASSFRLDVFSYKRLFTVLIICLYVCKMFVIVMEAHKESAAKGER